MGFSIYMIRNTVNDKVYIGETVQPVEDRLAFHKRQLECGSHPKAAMQSDWNTFGAAAFEFSLLRYYHDDLSVGARRRIERGWMHRLRANEREFGYNTIRVWPINFNI